MCHSFVSFVARLALREKQIQQSYRPIIAVHKWFARRPGTLFRALILSEFVQRPVQETYYQPHQLTGVSIPDPFMGGETAIIEAQRLGCSVIGPEINPISYRIVREAPEPISMDAYMIGVTQLVFSWGFWGESRAFGARLPLGWGPSTSSREPRTA